MKKHLLYSFLIAITLLSCSKDSNTLVPGYKTKNVIILVMDGPRYSETWGDPTHQYIPYMSNVMAEKGVVYTNFTNEGSTFTTPGHAAVTTGVYESINNSGDELPTYPSIFQQWRKSKETDSLTSWIISSKDKLEVLSNCQDPNWSDTSRPSTSCGENGLGSGHRTDNATFERAMEILADYKPQLALVQFRQPDLAGHQNNWEAYLQGIRDSDRYMYEIWNFIQNDSYYKATTTVFITNDHGRHLDGIANGFIGHGDDCQGCKHINLFVSGPDFPQNQIINTSRELIDIPSTIAELLDFEMPNGNGVVMEELFD